MKKTTINMDKTSTKKEKRSNINTKLVLAGTALLPCVAFTTDAVAQIQTITNFTNSTLNRPGALAVSAGFDVFAATALATVHPGFQGAGVGDFKIQIGPNGIVIDEPTGTNEDIIRFVGGGGYYPNVLTSMAAVSSGNVNDGFFVGAVLDPVQQFFLTYPGGAGDNWENPNTTTSTNGFLGFEFRNGGDTHYGLIEVEIQDRNHASGHTVKLVSITVQRTPNTPLNVAPTPVELISFAAQPVQDLIRLNWNTSSEVNNAGFEVQRSMDGENFQALSFVEGNGTTDTAQDYIFDDKDLRSGQLYYYRLKQIDYDGSSEYSDIVSAKLEGSALVISEFYPNPSTDALVNLKYEAASEDKLSVRVFNTHGQQVLQVFRDLSAGFNNLSFDFSSLSKGAYFVKLESNSGHSYQKLILD